METQQSKDSECYAAAMRMLVRREHSQFELRQKLQLKDFDSALIAGAIDLLIEQNYQSDLRFAEDFITMRFNQGKGPIKISGELKQRGIEVFDLSVFDWLDSARNIRMSKYGDDLPESYNEIAKQKRFLQSRGFDFDQINQAFSP
ncbi:MAG: recombination regulator RecX [Gammaproteobacteria bacterium]|nr:recombination regulator RecX [Gammaproteobacteria bacterium]